ncbi:MAG TPA: gamma-glutamylcyclotransferase family protein [Opitutaceae bacterium]|nr:gamma-glutamylcyclotransferase family protein [Opitutaceae bacterium]
MPFLFAYGALLEPERQKILFGRETPPEPATLLGWRKVLYADGYFGVLPTPGAETTGGLLTVTDTELAAADEWEDIPKLYRREETFVLIGSTCIACWVYVHQPTFPYTEIERQTQK